ncbi:hypothetical protein KA107_03575 [Candidatus Pacearchaeota archaeon]|nr:hypothetical protein [Candidatus Pacearchaeota archaeon]
MVSQISAALEKIGLTGGEIEVYLALLELGLSSTGKITRIAGISSSKVYEVLQRLINKGLASYVVQNGIKHYSATPAVRLMDLLDGKKAEIDSVKEEIDKFLPELELKRQKQTSAEAIVYRGKQGPLIALQETLDVAKTGEEILGFGTDEDDYLIHYPAQLKAYIKEQLKYKVKVRLIFGEGFKSPNSGASIRYLTKGLTAPIRTMIYGEKVAIVDFNTPFTTIIIEKKEVAESYRKHFDLLWKIAKK